MPLWLSQNTGCTITKLTIIHRDCSYRYHNAPIQDWSFSRQLMTGNQNVADSQRGAPATGLRVIVG